MTQMKAVRSISNTKTLAGQFKLSFTYIACPKCGKRLFQVRTTTKKPCVYMVDKDHPPTNASMTTKCDRCRSIVAMDA